MLDFPIPSCVWFIQFGVCLLLLFLPYRTIVTKMCTDIALESFLQPFSFLYVAVTHIAVLCCDAHSARQALLS